MALRVKPLSWIFSAEKGVATNVITTSPGVLHGFLVETDGTNNVTVQFYNHASAATNPMTPSIVVSGGDRYGGALGIDTPFGNGCVCIVSGSGGVVTVYYRLD